MGQAGRTLKGLAQARTTLQENLQELMTAIKAKRAVVSTETTRLALSHRGLIRCLSADGIVLRDSEEVADRGPVVRFELTPRGRNQA